MRQAPDELIIHQMDTSPSLMGLNDNGDKEDTIQVLENTNVTLECRSVGGQPPPKLFWELPPSVPSFSLSEVIRDGSAVSVISVLVMRSQLS